MKKEVFDSLKNEIKYIGLLFLLAIIIFKIIFFKENLIVLFRNVLSLFWLFVMPGYFIMLYWKDKLEFMERFIVGIAIAAAIIGISSYYIGLMGLNIKYHGIFMPIVIIVIGLVMAKNKKADNSKN